MLLCLKGGVGQCRILGTVLNVRVGSGGIPRVYVVTIASGALIPAQFYSFRLYWWFERVLCKMGVCRVRLSHKACSCCRKNSLVHGG